MAVLAPPAPSGTSAPVDILGLADAAVAALVEEIMLTPKPGLVDRRGGGSHRDMDVGLMLSSARALRPAFARMAAPVPEGADLGRMRTRLAAIGRDAEQAMFTVTGGVNTHRGAIWALGLAIGALASMSGDPAPVDARTVLLRVAEIARNEDAGRDRSVSPAPTVGGRARERYGVPGAVGAACAGFPQALAAFEIIRHPLVPGSSRTHVLLDALLTSMTTLDDTCLLSRGGHAGLVLSQRGAGEVLRLGGSASPAGSIAFARLDAALLAAGLSPGGSADMLSLALLLETVSTSRSRRS